MINTAEVFLWGTRIGIIHKEIRKIITRYGVI